MVFPAGDLSQTGGVACHQGHVLPSTPRRYFLSYLVLKQSSDAGVGDEGEGDRSVVYAIVTPLSLSQQRWVSQGLHLQLLLPPLNKRCPQGSEPQDLSEKGPFFECVS